MAQDTVCEGDGAGGHVKLEYRFTGSRQYEAVTMTYGSNNVLDNPQPVFNYMGPMLFRGLYGIEFNVFSDSGDFFVTVPAFGEQMITTKGNCTATKGRKLR